MQITTMEQIKEMPKRFRAKVVYPNGYTASRMIIVEDNRFAVVAKGSRTRGSWHYGFQEVSALEPMKESAVDEATKWAKTWNKALKMLKESGLWEDVQKEIETVLAIGYDKVNKAYSASWESDKTDEERIANVKAVDSRLVSVNEEGKEFLNTSILWYMTVPAKIKKMYFGKHNNDFYLDMIANALKNKEKCHTSAVAGYDVRFEYNPERNKAWYSEEYRGCGNGHYYIALSATHALFSEDD